MESEPSKGVVLCHPRFVPIRHQGFKDPAQVLLERIEGSLEYALSEDCGRSVLTALAVLSDINGIIAGHGVSTVALRAGLSRASTVTALESLRDEGFLMEFDGPKGLVWVLPNPDPEDDVL